MGVLEARLDASQALRSLRFVESGLTEEDLASTSSTSVLIGQLQEYFQGRRREFEIPLAPQGTEFQQRVWAELRRIPWGQTITYAELARRIGDPQAVRAVARANALNPIWLLIPCHRVIGSDGSLTGYAGGLERKAKLLQLEGALPLEPPAQISLFSKK